MSRLKRTFSSARAGEATDKQRSSAAKMLHPCLPMPHPCLSMQHRKGAMESCKGASEGCKGATERCKGAMEHRMALFGRDMSTDPRNIPRSRIVYSRGAGLFGGRQGKRQLFNPVIATLSTKYRWAAKNRI